MKDGAADGLVCQFEKLSTQRREGRKGKRAKQLLLRALRASALEIFLGSPVLEFEMGQFRSAKRTRADQAPAS